MVISQLLVWATDILWHAGIWMRALHERETPPFDEFCDP